MDKLITAILDGDSAMAVSKARQLNASGLSPEKIIIEGVEAAMSALDTKCTLEDFNLLEIMLAGRAVMEVTKLFWPSGAVKDSAKGTVVIAALEGDVHDLGKNILKMVLTGKGYNVVDCGKNCPLQKLADAAAAERPLAVGLSGLITTVIPVVRQVKGALAARGLDNVKVFAGGAALKQSTPGMLNVDFVAESAFDVLRFLSGLGKGIR
ncbi:MAG: cobalamin-dependent protein [Nitrospiraceae bacterium]|nr:cobalamin-dependent protein [Nitrospiraceae bacterium]